MSQDIIRDWRKRLSESGWHPYRIGTRDDIWIEGSRQLDFFWPTKTESLVVRFLYRNRGDLGNVRLIFNPEEDYTLSLIVSGGKN